MSITNRFDLTGKTALVTGCKRGLGKSMALALAEAGADIIGVSLSLETSGSEIEKEVTAQGRRFTAYQCDLSSREAVHEFTDKVLKDNPVIDILLNNAGTIQRAPAIEHADALWDEVIEVNLSTPFIITRDIGKSMIAKGSGKVIFTASLLTFQGGINVPGYAASKGAIGQLTKAFANEWAPLGINVNAIAPGYFVTDNTKALRSDVNRANAILERIPAGRWGKPDDLAGAIVFLASAASDYVHGTIMTVDGGWLGR